MISKIAVAAVFTLAAGAAIAGAPAGSGEVIDAGGVRIRALTTADLLGSWGNVQETGAAPTYPFTYACAGQGIGEAVQPQRQGPVGPVTLSNGSAVQASGAFAVVKDKGKLAQAHRTLVGEFGALQPVTDVTLADADTIAFTAGKTAYRLQRIKPLKWTYAADGTRINADYSGIFEPAMFIYALSYRQDGLPKTDYLVKCLD